MPEATITTGWPLAGEAAALVGHQRDQRADDDGEVGRRQPGQLVAEALPAAGRHHDQRVAPVERGLDGLALPGPERLMAEVRQERVGIATPAVGANVPVRDLGLIESLESLECEPSLGLSCLCHSASLGRDPAPKTVPV